MKTPIMDAYINIENVSKIYQRGDSEFVALSGINLTVQKGEFLSIVGPSGSGKSTLMHLIGAMDKPTDGRISVGGECVTASSTDAIAWRSKMVGFVFQRAFLMPGLSALQNVEVPLISRKYNAEERRRRATLALELVDLSSHLKHRPREMSGGQEQRTALARALVTDPPLLLCDEPTGNLDRESADSVLRLLKLLSKELQKTVIVVTHDPVVAQSSDRTVKLEKGKLVSDSLVN